MWRAAGVVAAAALFLSAASLTLTSLQGAQRGLNRTVWLIAPDGSRRQVVRDQTAYIGSESIDKERRDAGLPPGDEYEWSGIWWMRDAGEVAFDAPATVRQSLTIDGVVVVPDVRPPDSPSQAARMVLAPGAHRIQLRYARRGFDAFSISWMSHGSSLRPFGQAEIYPGIRAQRAAAELAPLRRAAATAWMLAALLFAIAVVPHVSIWLRADRSTARRRLAIGTLVTAVVMYAAVLRFDAMEKRWGPVPGSASTVAFERRVANLARAIEPHGMSWRRSPYQPGGDPYSYLQQAREQTHFYAARLREPLFPYAIKLVLQASGQADASVVLASLAFACLLVLATFLLGAEAFSPWVGLGAAIALAVEREVIGFSVSGYRDDAFACFVVLVAWLSLRAVKQPSALRLAAWGVAAAAACLTRITALSFVMPALLYIAWRVPVRARARAVAVAGGVLALLVTPYLASCWLRFGTPFYAVTGVSGGWEWDQHGGAGGGTGYLRALVFERPALFSSRLGEAAAIAFTNKWNGFAGLGNWHAGAILAAAALCGLVGFLFSDSGRFLLLVALTSPIPFALIAGMLPPIAQYRYSLHEYPLFLIGSFSAFAWAGRRLAAFVWPLVRRVGSVGPISPAASEKGAATYAPGTATTPHSGR